MSKADKNYRKGLKKYIQAQMILLESIEKDINRNIEDIVFEKRKKGLNQARFKIELRSLEIAKENLRESEKK